MKILRILTILTIGTTCAHTNHKELIEKTYGESSGFTIPQHEDQYILDAGGEPTYGEVTYKGAAKLFKKFKLKKNDVFYDLGCGTGKLVIQAYLTSPAQKCVGIELSKTRYKVAEKAKKALAKEKKLEKKRKLNFQNNNLLKSNIDDASAIYVSSLCFSDDLMKKLTEKLSSLKNGLQLATLRMLPENDHFKFIKTLTLPMTWSNNCPVHIYKLINPKK